MKKYFFIAFLALSYFNVYGQLCQLQNIYPLIGNVGVHTQNPQKPIHIFGDNNNPNCGDVALRLSYLPPQPTPECWGHLSMRTISNFMFYTTITGNVGDVILQSDYNAGDLILTTRKLSSKIRFATTPPPGGNDFERMTILPDGNVGIGETTPTSRLVVRGMGATSGTGAFSVLDITGTPLFHINDAGYVGIGTTAPQNKLHVLGKARFSEILIGTGANPINVDTSGNLVANAIKSMTNIVATGTICAKEVNIINTPCQWPDYVFKDDYELLPLEDLETAIQQKGTLPDIPSENEVSQNGVNVGEMQALLLKKVEELTLYVIQINKENQELQKQNKELFEEIKALKSK